GRGYIETVKSKTILLTGGCGFLGQHLTRLLLEAFPDAHIRIIDLAANPFAYQDFSVEPRVETRLGLDICNLPSIEDSFQGVDSVVHLASLVSSSLIDKQALERINVLGTRNVLRAARHHDVNLFLHVSSVAGLGFTDNPQRPADESLEFDWSIARASNNHYMLSKSRADREVEAYRRSGGAAVIVYPAILFGPGDYRNSARIIRAVARGRGVVSLPGGSNVADVRDVGRGIVAALQRDVRGGNYLLSGWNLSVHEIFSTIASVVGARRPRITLPTFLRPLLYRGLLATEVVSRRRLALSASDADLGFRYRYFDNSKALQSLGWAPAINFRQTVTDAFAWMRSRGIA
ncbi:MAG: NAD-dependent epimerase/dehydratase family protein, partial [Candidatus Neomarinimicrobiota bacterium]